MAGVAGKVAIVTGGAGGIGAAVVGTLAARGAAVVVADMVGDAADAVAADIVKNGGRAIPVEVDVADEASVVAMIAAAVDAFGRLDIVHNNAAAMGDDVLGRDGDLTTMAVEVWDTTMAVDLRGPMLACKHAIPIMVEQGGGSIVNTASVAAHAGDMQFMAYGAAKAGLVNLTKAIATRYGKANVRCNAIAPGMILTPTAQQRLSADVIDMVMRHHLTTRVGTPQDIAEAVAFLSSDEAGYITGHVLFVDGGVTAHLPHVADMYESV
ncbi:MAG: short-chain dehydrogenase/reductase [Acidimicrobiales bacterium]|jgi:NAD(P)-dependent dehydrogenase (short-subunit alcohol dehydrogenase family)|nr:short-chain dehydrogenase/reductase [Acidimicrobiales bacterium]